MVTVNDVAIWKQSFSMGYFYPMIVSQHSLPLYIFLGVVKNTALSHFLNRTRGQLLINYDPQGRLREEGGWVNLTIYNPRSQDRIRRANTQSDD